MHAMLSMFHATGRAEFLNDLAASVRDAQGDSGNSRLKAVY